MSTDLKIFLPGEKTLNVDIFKKGIENTTEAIQANIEGAIIRISKVDMNEWSFIIEVDCEESAAEVKRHCEEVEIKVEEIMKTPE